MEVYSANLVKKWAPASWGLRNVKLKFLIPEMTVRKKLAIICSIFPDGDVL